MKFKIGIVIGNHEQIRLVQAFDLLNDTFDVAFFLTERADLSAVFPVASKVYLFEDLRDMPGYLRGLDEHLESMDLLIGVDSSRLASFQMIRYAAKSKIPTIIMTGEAQPFLYANYPNIRAIQSDIIEHADRFICFSDLAGSVLKVEGVKAEKIKRVNCQIDDKRFKYTEAARMKFREYLSIPSRDRLILYHGPITHNLKLQEIIAALRVNKAVDPHNHNRLLFVGDGDGVKDLKYYCHDFHTGSSVMFMHQDPERFLGDLYAAADVRVYPRSADQLPLDLLESTACGAVPVYPANANIADILHGAGRSLTDTSMQGWLDAFNDLLTQSGSIESAKSKCISMFRQHYDAQVWKETVTGEIMALINQQNPARPERNALSKDAIESMIHKGQKHEADQLITTSLESRHLMQADRSELLRLRGDLLADAGSFDESVKSYEESLQCDHSNYRSYRGLGYVAFRGHSNEDAIGFFKKALGKNKDDGPSLMGVGLVHRRLGLNEEALFWLEKSADIDGMSNALTTTLLQTCLECKKPKVSIATLERVMDQQVPNPSVLMTLGQLYIKEGNIERGSQLMDEARRIEDKKAS
jgi:tetratricopeptide (TPR) repeat protein